MTRQTGKRAGLIIALIVAVTLSALYLGNARIFEVLEEKTLDMRFLLRGKITPGPETVIAARTVSLAPIGLGPRSGPPHGRRGQGHRI
jgi:hypothetical protein